MTAETIKPQPITKPTKTRKRTKSPSKQQITAMVLEAGLTQEQVAAQTGVCQQRVSQIIQEVKNDKNFLDFTKNKDKVFENLQYKIINLAGSEALKTMLNKRGFTDVAILEDKIRLIRGESTSNISYDARSITASISELREMLKSSEAGTELDNQVIDITSNGA